MKKEYIAPSVNVVKIRLASHLMTLSADDTYSITDTEASTNAFVKSESSSRYNVWDDDWSAN